MRISDWSSEVCSSDLNGEARKAAEFYAATFPDSHVGAGNASANDNPSARAGEELTVEFTVLGQSFVGLNGGPHFKPNEAVRSEKRRVGTECGRPCSSRWSPLHSKKKRDT